MEFRKCFSAILGLTLLTTALVAAPAMAIQKKAKTSAGYSLVFDPAKCTKKSVTFNGKTIYYRAYEKIVYVKYPVDINYEVMNIFIPEEYYEGKSCGKYNAKTAPILLPNMVSGYMPAEPESLESKGPSKYHGPIGTGKDGQENSGPFAALKTALSKGYIIASPGARGITTQDKNGRYTGKAPACIIDLKAAVRYLRFNDKIMPGDAEKIISDSASAGGALSGLLGVTGNNKDYEPYLKALGAADARDDIFAACCYCPITNLDNADKAYEWMYNGVNEFDKNNSGGTPATHCVLTAEQIKMSDELKAMFPAYLNGLGLKTPDGKALTLDANGNGTFKDYVKSFVIASAQKALDSGKDLSGLTWITIKDKVVVDIDFNQYIKYVKRTKTPPAFDTLDFSSENQLFGTATINAQHFTQFSKEHSKTGNTFADPAIVKMMNPMNYIGKAGSTPAKYWRIRHGSIDAHTSLAIPVILATALENKNSNVDFAIPWNQGHGGDYDLDDLFAWMDKICGESSK